MATRRAGAVLAHHSLLCLSLVAAFSACDMEGPFQAAKVTITVESLPPKTGGGRVVNLTVPEGDEPFEIDCRFPADYDYGLGTCTDDFFDADGRGSIQLEAAPDSASRLTGLDDDCVESQGTICTLVFSGESLARTGRFRFEAIPPSSVLITPASSIITELGREHAVVLKATIRGPSGQNLGVKPLFWRSSDQSVATIDATWVTATIIGVAEGVATITARTHGGVEGTATVTVALGAVTIFDQMDSGGVWFDTVRVTQGGATADAWHEAAGGVVGGYRRMQHVLPDTSGINVFHGFTGQTYDPRTQGAIESVSASWYRRKIAPEEYAAVGEKFALMQGGTIYVGPGGEFQNQEWEPFQVSDVVPSQFFPVPGPDFSASGEVITFGFIRSNTHIGRSPVTIVHGTDEYRVVIQR